MSDKLKHKKFKLSLAVIIRLIIFFAVVIILVSYFSSKNTSKVVLGESIEIKPFIDNIYQKIPPQSRKNLENISTNPAIISLQTKIKSLQSETNGFPQKQINDIKKAVVNQIYQNVMKSL